VKDTIFHHTPNSEFRTKNPEPTMRRSALYHLLGLLLGVAACQNTTEFEGFATATWKSDRMACTGKRQQMKEDFEKIRQKLKGLNQMEVVDVLGKPDLQRLDDRNMKSYLYFLEPASTCPSGRADAQVVILRFNAVDRVLEITYEQGTPL